MGVFDEMPQDGSCITVAELATRLRVDEEMLSLYLFCKGNKQSLIYTNSTHSSSMYQYPFLQRSWAIKVWPQCSLVCIHHPRKP